MSLLEPGHFTVANNERQLKLQLEVEMVVPAVANMLLPVIETYSKEHCKSIFLLALKETSLCKASPIPRLITLFWL